MEIEIRSDSVTIDGYVNAVGRESRSIFTADGKCKEIIEPGTFRKGLERATDVKLMLNHNKDKTYASTADGSLKLCEDNIGLRAHWSIVNKVDKQRGKIYRKFIS